LAQDGTRFGIVIRTLGKIVLKVGLVLFCSIVGAASGVANDHALIEDKATLGEKRTIDFESDQSLGELYLDNSSDRGAVSIGRHSHRAQGKVTIFVPNGMNLTYEPNSRAIEDPKLFSGVMTTGIDVLRVRVLELEDSEQGRCDRFMHYVPIYLKSLREVIVDNSDVTDDGLSQLQNMPRLESISSIGCKGITGRCLLALSKLPCLHLLNLRDHNIAETNLQQLPLFPALTYLGVRNTALSEAGVKVVARCPKLVDLDLVDNRKVDDNCLADLNPLKHLRRLELCDTAVTDRGMHYLLRFHELKSMDLSRTRVTLKGLLVLKPLKLDGLKLSDCYSQSDMPQIRSIAKFIDFEHVSKPVTKEVRTMFAPLH
jgi:hypothetical protein